ncbi:unannotated protein [freshwater metagenome]|uniref:Unannotated protein n=1 Tax=freshwater metagenome TaxID=449393 RepID=A0A6J6KJX9_9ZZZZ
MAIGKTKTDSYSATGVFKNVPPRNGKVATNATDATAIRILVNLLDLSQRSAPKSLRFIIMPSFV